MVFLVYIHRYVWACTSSVCRPVAALGCYRLQPKPSCKNPTFISLPLSVRPGPAWMPGEPRSAPDCSNSHFRWILQIRLPRSAWVAQECPTLQLELFRETTTDPLPSVRMGSPGVPKTAARATLSEHYEFASLGPPGEPRSASDCSQSHCGRLLRIPLPWSA